MPELVEPHLRPCYACGAHDDSPRVQATDSNGNMALFHYQCVPDQIVPLLHPEDVAHVESGLKDDELRAAILAVEHRDLGLDPNHPNYIGDEEAATA